jgi:hypothetical protein
VTVLLALQNQGMSWEIGSIVEVIGQAQGNPTPTLQEYTSIPFSKDFSQTTQTHAGGAGVKRCEASQRALQRSDGSSSRLNLCLSSSDLPNYDKLVQLMNGKHQSLFM